VIGLLPRGRSRARCILWPLSSETRITRACSYLLRFLEFVGNSDHAVGRRPYHVLGCWSAMIGAAPSLCRVVLGHCLLIARLPAIHCGADLINSGEWQDRHRQSLARGRIEEIQIAQLKAGRPFGAKGEPFGYRAIAMLGPEFAR